MKLVLPIESILTLFTPLTRKSAVSAPVMVLLTVKAEGVCATATEAVTRMSPIVITHQASRDGLVIEAQPRLAADLRSVISLKQVTEKVLARYSEVDHDSHRFVNQG
jgi:hypothetical protein